MRKLQCGHTLVETLVVVAIISILMALYLPTLVKVRRKAEEVVIKEGFRQEYIGRFADSANSAGGDRPGKPGRDTCRQVFRQKVVNGQYNLWVTELKYQVRSEDEFRAYWFTLLDPAATFPLAYDNDALIAHDDAGKEFRLGPLTSWSAANGNFAVGWEFISTDLTETSSGTLGASVLFTDGHTEYIRYPTAYPMCRSVAELSHRFVVGG